jgi:hypothetical protein
MGKKTKKKEKAPNTGDAQVMEIFHYNLFSRQIPTSGKTSTFLVLELNGEPFEGSSLQTIQVIFVPDDHPIPPPRYHELTVTSFQPMSHYIPFMDMVGMGIEAEDKYSILYGFYSALDNSVDVYLSSGLSPEDAYASLKRSFEGENNEDQAS